MKKLLIPLLLLLSMSFLIAVESAPSATVGYIARPIVEGGYECFSIPFQVSDVDGITGIQMADVLYGQGGEGDQFQSMGSGLTAYSWGGVWDEVLAPTTDTYWYYREFGNADASVYLFGTVNPTTTSFTMNGDDGGNYTCFGINDARNVSILDLDINTADLVDGDQIQDMQSGLTAYFWAPDWDTSVLASLEAGHTYWFTHTGAALSFTYDPTNNTIAKAVHSKASTKSRKALNNK